MSKCSATLASVTVAAPERGRVFGRSKLPATPSQVAVLHYTPLSQEPR